MKLIKIYPEEYDSLTKHIYKLTGITLDKSKTYLVETRLSALLEEYSCDTFEKFNDLLMFSPPKPLITKLINAITTNETLFFRDNSPFQLLKNKLIPDLIDYKRNRNSILLPTINIWSAACSTGQELYSIAIVLKEILGDFSRYNIRILGTDISDNAVSKASYGEYSNFEINRGVSPEIKEKYFTKINDNKWRIKDELRALISVKRLNLMENFEGIGKFDIILCRNVAIYFSDEDKEKLFLKLGKQLHPHGYLLIGSQEFLNCPLFVTKRHLNATYYQLKEN